MDAFASQAIAVPTVKQHHEVNEKVMSFYAALEEMLEAVETKNNRHMPAQLKLIDPYIRQAALSMEKISDTYHHFVKRGGKSLKEDSAEIEEAARRIFIEMNKLLEEVKKV